MEGFTRRTDPRSGNVQDSAVGGSLVILGGREGKDKGARKKIPRCKPW